MRRGRWQGRLYICIFSQFGNLSSFCNSVRELHRSKSGKNTAGIARPRMTLPWASGELRRGCRHSQAKDDSAMGFRRTALGTACPQHLQLSRTQKRLALQEHMKFNA